MDSLTMRRLQLTLLTLVIVAGHVVFANAANCTCTTRMSERCHTAPITVCISPELTQAKASSQE
jgi:hypothetical protein